MRPVIFPIDMYGAWLRSAGTLLRNFEQHDPARVRMLVDDAQYNGDIDPREVVEVVPLGIRTCGDLYGSFTAILTVYDDPTGWSHAQATSIAGDGAGDPHCSACWPRRCDCDADPSMPACPQCRTNADVLEDVSSDNGDHVCHACGEEFIAPRKTRAAQPDPNFDGGAS